MDHLVALDTKEVQGPADKHDPVNPSFHLFVLSPETSLF